MSLTVDVNMGRPMSLSRDSFSPGYEWWVHLSFSSKKTWTTDMTPGRPCGRTHEWIGCVSPESDDMLCGLYGMRLMKSHMHTAFRIEKTNSLSCASLTDPCQLQTKKPLRTTTIHEHTQRPCTSSRRDVYCERRKFERCHYSKNNSSWLDDLRHTCWRALTCVSPHQNDDHAHQYSFRFRNKPPKLLFLREQNPLW